MVTVDYVTLFVVLPFLVFFFLKKLSTQVVFLELIVKILWNKEFRNKELSF